MFFFYNQYNCVENLKNVITYPFFIGVLLPTVQAVDLSQMTDQMPLSKGYLSELRRLGCRPDSSSQRF